MRSNIDFTVITACGECCVGCKKKENGMCKGCIESDGVKNGHSLKGVQYIDVRENIMYNFVDYVKNFLVNG